MPQLFTEFGTAKIYNGYYRITTKVEGFHNQLLHRLIMAKHLGCGIPPNYSVHHINGDKTDNRLENLEIMKNTEHLRLHKLGRTNSDEHKRKRSLTTNQLGIRNVSKSKSKEHKRGFRYRYRWMENGKHHTITSVDLEKLEQKVRDRGLPWEVFDKGDV